MDPPLSHLTEISATLCWKLLAPFLLVLDFLKRFYIESLENLDHLCISDFLCVWPGSSYKVQTPNRAGDRHNHNLGIDGSWISPPGSTYLLQSNETSDKWRAWLCHISFWLAFDSFCGFRGLTREMCIPVFVTEPLIQDFPMNGENRLQTKMKAGVNHHLCTLTALCNHGR